MAYTLTSGVQPEGIDNVPRSLLLGLPVIALILSFGAIAHRNALESPVASAKAIPIAAKAIQPGGKNNNTGSNSSSPNSNTGASAGTAAAGGSSATSGSSLAASGGGGSSSLSAAPSSGGSSLTSSTTPTGGMGGGGTTSSGGGSTSGGTLPVSQTVTVPPVDLQAGDKTLLSTSGSTIYVN
jgi:hypothetical protein